MVQVFLIIPTSCIAIRIAKDCKPTVFFEVSHDTNFIFTNAESVDKRNKTIIETMKTN